MTFDELKEEIARLFPRDQKEPVDRYKWWIKQATEPFRNRGECESAWAQIAQYDGNSNRPKLKFFYNVAAGIKDNGKKDFVYYKCSCGKSLSESSAGGCPVCHNSGASLKVSMNGVPALPVQASCFDCTIYDDVPGSSVLGPRCPEYGTPAFNDCKMRGVCRCVTCCRFEYMRTYHPERLRENYRKAMSDLPSSISESAKAFHDGRADVVDINKLLKTMAEKKKAKSGGAVLCEEHGRLVGSVNTKNMDNKTYKRFKNDR